MFKYLNRGLSTPVAIGIIAVLVVVVGGGILAYQYYYISKQETKSPTAEENNLQTTKLFTIPEKHYLVFSSAISPIFSPDNKHFAYIVGSERGKSFVILDGNEHKTYDYVDSGSLIFSSDNKHFAYIAANNIKWLYKADRPVGGEWWVVFDGVEQKEYQNIHSLIFSNDGKQIAYVASKPDSNKEFIVLNSKEQKNYDSIHSPIFSSNNSRFTYVVRQGGKEFLVLNGIEQNNVYDRIKYLSFSSDGQQIAYVARKGSVGLKEVMGGVMLPYDAEFVVLNGVEQKQYENIDEVHFHAGGKFTYRGFDGRRFFLVIDGKEYENGRDPVFSQNNNHFAYVVIEKGENWSMVLDGVIQQYHGIISPMVFSADGKHYIYVVQPKGSIKEFVVVDGVAKPERDANIIFTSFSPSGKNFSYIAQQNNQKSLVILDEKELSQYDKVWKPRFTKDGKHFIYNVFMGRELWLIVNSIE